MKEDRDVAVIGCGLMGSALARALARNGFSVAAWNRTFERAEALAGDGVTPVADIAEAVGPAPMVLACTATYETTRSALESIEDWAGKTLINVGTSTPEDAEEMERWATGRGAAYLDGAIICYPPEIGTAKALILYSGSPEVWREYEETLMTLAGGSRHVSERVGNASVLDGGIVGVFASAALAAFVEAATYVLGQGVPAEVLDELTAMSLAVMNLNTHEAIVAIENDEHETHTATISTYAAGIRAFLPSIQAAGINARFTEATLKNLDEAEAAGLGELGFYAQTTIARGS